MIGALIRPRLEQRAFLLLLAAVSLPTLATASSPRSVPERAPASRHATASARTRMPAVVRPVSALDERLLWTHPVQRDMPGVRSERCGDLLETQDALWIAWVSAGPDLNASLAVIHLVRITRDKAAAEPSPIVATLSALSLSGRLMVRVVIPSSDGSRQMLEYRIG